MSEVFNFKCDWCKTIVPAIYNGEHFLPPSSWVVFCTAVGLSNLRVHACNKCFLSIKKKIKV